MNKHKSLKLLDLKLVSIAIAIFAIANLIGANNQNTPSLNEIKNQNKQLTIPLSIGVINRIPVKMNDGITTIVFPGPITEIAGRNISSTGNNTDFAIMAQPNATSFSIVAMAPNVNATLTVTYKNNLYILYIYQDSKEACATVRFTDTETLQNCSYTNSTPNVSSARLISLIDIAKNYTVLQEKYPTLLHNTQRKLFKNRYRCGTFDIHLLSVTRFEEEDTLIFQLELENLTDKEILYDKHSFSAHTGRSISYMSVSDASGIMPPKSVTSAYFGITSTSKGGRNNLLPDNDWLLGLSTRDVHQNQITQINDTINSNLKKAKEAKIAQEKLLNEKLKKLDSLSKKIDQDQQELDKKLIQLNTLEKKLKKQEANLQKEQKSFSKAKDQRAIEEKKIIDTQKKLDSLSKKIDQDQQELDQKLIKLTTLEEKLKKQEAQLLVDQKSLSLAKDAFAKDKDDFINKNQKELDNYKKQLDTQEKLRKAEHQKLLLTQQAKIDKLTSNLKAETLSYQQKNQQLNKKDIALKDKETKLLKLQNQLESQAKELSTKEQVAKLVINDLVTKTLPKLTSLKSDNSSSNNTKKAKEEKVVKTPPKTSSIFNNVKK